MIELILIIFERVLTYGPSVITELAPLFENREDLPTADEIRELKITKTPMEYFE